MKHGKPNLKTILLRNSLPTFGWSQNVNMDFKCVLLWISVYPLRPGKRLLKQVLAGGAVYANST